MSEGGRYVRLVALFGLALVALLAGFNLFVDPYGHFDVPRIPGVNERSLGFNRQPLLAKSLAISRVQPASIILGNSRPESAYDPLHPGFAARPAYNLAVGGAGLGQIRRLFLEALATGRLRQVLLATDLSMFDPSLQTAHTVPEVFMLADDEGWIAGAGRRARRMAFLLLSGTVTADSWWSLRHQRDPVVLYSPSGVREGSADERRVESEGGHRSASLLTEAAFFATTLLDITSPTFHRGYDALLGEFRELVAISARRGIRLDVVINPIHARHTYVYAAAGLWPIYEQWKRDLVAAAANAGGAVALWDFSGVSACTSEPMPAQGDAKTKMRWYRESGHFRPGLGTLVLDRIFGLGEADECPGLGSRLEAATLETTLAEQRAALRRWVASHPGDVAEIDALARRYGRAPSPAPSGPFFLPSTMMQSPNRTSSDVIPGSGNPRLRVLVRMMRATNRSTRRVAHRRLRTSAFVEMR